MIGSTLRSTNILIGMTAAILTLIAPPARAQFFVPDECLTGFGIYDGDLVGDVEWDTATGFNGDELEITFYDEIALEWSDGDLDVVTFTDIEIDDDGFFAFIAEDEFTGNLIDVEGFFYDDCVVAGDYILDLSGTAVEFIGDFEMEADVIIVDPPVGSGACGFSGIFTMTLTVIGMTAATPAVRRRLNRRRAA